ncbi:hypothetical protein IQ07DRAFT_596785 [Pyrenochaeta sp. DS3sAY3a]|nr:hypothetical protein IQ07DRAFT_596785 [Pyrenochaeta sp. DS3sAY3a]
MCGPKIRICSGCSKEITFPVEYCAKAIANHYKRCAHLEPEVLWTPCLTCSQKEEAERQKRLNASEAELKEYEEKDKEEDEKVEEGLRLMEEGGKRRADKWLEDQAQVGDEEGGEEKSG